MRAKLTYANVVATLALIVAVAGGSAAVALSVGKNSVKASSIKAGNVTARELAGVRVVRATATGFTSAVARCAKNEQLLSGGGITNSSSGDPALIESQPVGNSWSARGTDSVASPNAVSSAVALCLKSKPGK